MRAARCALIGPRLLAFAARCRGLNRPGQAGELNNSWRVAFMALVRGQPAAPEAIAAGVASWNRHMGMLDAQLARTGAFVTGADFTLADVVLGLSAQRWKNAPITRAEPPAVEAYLQRIASRPGFSEYVGNGMP